MHQIFCSAKANYFSPQVLATDIPTAESLKIISTAEDVNAPPLPPTIHTESVLKRDEWMMMPPSTLVLPAEDIRATDHRSRLSRDTGDDSLVDGYGENSNDSRNLGGGIDFFSSLGTEKKKPPRPEKPNPDKVFPAFYFFCQSVNQPCLSSKSVIGNLTKISRRVDPLTLMNCLRLRLQLLLADLVLNGE